MRATLEIPAEVETFQDVRVRVIIEKVRDIDTRAEVVFEQFIERLAHDQGERTCLVCELNTDHLVGRCDLFARVHVDLDGDGQISRGDLLTQQSCRLPEGAHEWLIPVERVGG